MSVSLTIACNTWDLEDPASVSKGIYAAKAFLRLVCKSIDAVEHGRPSNLAAMLLFL